MHVLVLPGRKTLLIFNINNARITKRAIKLLMRRQCIKMQFIVVCKPFVRKMGLLRSTIVGFQKLIVTKSRRQIVCNIEKFKSMRSQAHASIISFRSKRKTPFRSCVYSRLSRLSFWPVFVECRTVVNCPIRFPRHHFGYTL